MAAPVVFKDGRYNGRTLREWLPDLIDAIVDASDPLQIILFGSLGSGHEDRDSDVDLLVVLPHVENKHTAAASLRRATRNVPIPKDLIATDPAELAARGDEPGSVLRDAVQTGQVVYERR